MVSVSFEIRVGESYRGVDAGVSSPQCDCSTLELISPDNWITIDGWVTSVYMEVTV